MRVLAVAAFVALSACSPEIRLGEKDGIPPVNGASEVALDTFHCGETISSDGFVVTSMKVDQGCELTFDRDLEVISAADYARLADLRGAGNLLKAVELEIRTLRFVDANTQEELDPQTQLRDATLSVNGQVVADRGTLTSLPKRVVLKGNVIQELRAQIEARKPAVLHTRAVVVVADEPPPPRRLRVEYSAQPTIVLGF
jgi:hypothetical protein